MDMLQAQHMDNTTTAILFIAILAWPVCMLLKALDRLVKGQVGTGIIESLLMQLLPYTDIKRKGTEDLYLRRFFVYPRNKDFSKNVGKRRIYLHKFYRGDEDAHLHDHPWGFTSLILTQGYWEETTDVDALKSEGGTDLCYTIGADWEKRTQKWFGPGSILRRPATWKHRVVLDNTTPAWSIVRTGVKERSWGFWIDGEQCPYRQYDGALGICEEGFDENVLVAGTVGGGSGGSDEGILRSLPEGSREALHFDPLFD